MDIEHDGLVKGADNVLCAVIGKGNIPTRHCKKLMKTFYLHYQWFPFYVASLGILFYIPYMVFTYVNDDIKSLKDSIVDSDADEIVKAYFNYEVNVRTRMRLRILGNILVKILYIGSNVSCFLMTDYLFNHDFRTFGQAWSKWSKMENEIQYAYSPHRSSPTPGNFLLPTFGLCEVVEANMEIIQARSNVHRFVCEISMHVLYQYVLITLWYLVAIGIVVSCLGLLQKLIDHLWVTTCFLAHGSKVQVIYKNMSLREVEYLEYIRRKNLAKYRDVIQRITDQRTKGTIIQYPMRQYSPDKRQDTMENENVPFINGVPGIKLQNANGTKL